MHRSPEDPFELTDLRALTDKGLSLAADKASNQQKQALALLSAYLNDAVAIESTDEDELTVYTEDVLNQSVSDRVRQPFTEDLTQYIVFNEDRIDMTFNGVVIAIKAIIEHGYKRYTRERLAGAYSEKWPEVYLRAFDKTYLRLAECADQL